MKQESMKVLFFIRKSRLKKNGEAPVFLRVTINGQLDEVRIQRSVPLKLSTFCSVEVMGQCEGTQQRKRPEFNGAEQLY